MKIQSYKKTKSNIYEVTLDNNETIKFYDDIILKYELLINSSIDEKKLETILNDNNQREAYYIALKYISIKMRSKKEIVEYLKRKNFETSSINYAVKKLYEDNYLNDKDYIKAYITDAINLTSHGPNHIFFSLKKLGLKDDDIDNELSKIKSGVWIDKIDSIIDKKYKTNKYGINLFKKKITAYLIQDGYSTDLINDVLSTKTFDENNNIDVETQKILRKLSQKYQGDELFFHLKAKLYSKGFTHEEINNVLDKYK